jgi:archaellum component FlaG (FlaF/FlaG flagellin family)
MRLHTLKEVIRETMSSTTISEVIILIAATLLAGSFASYLISYSGIIQNNVATSIDIVRQQMNIRVKIMYATISEGCYIIYVKNIGYLPIYNSSFNSIDLYIGPYRRATLYKYSPTGGTGYFNIVDSDGDGVWEVGETAVLKACNAFISEPLYEVRVYVSGGVGDSYLFTPPP